MTQISNDYQKRLEELEYRFGDSWNSLNPIGFQAIIDADEREEMLVAGERMLDEFELNAEFVPLQYGGRLTRIDHMIIIMRSLYRHDPCLGLGYGASSLIAAVNIWNAGSYKQCCFVSDLLLNNRKLACSYYELKHGNDLTGVEFEAQPHGSALLLNGSKQVTTNIQRADAIVIFARTSPGIGSRKHSQILVDKAKVSSDSMSYLPRFKSAGMRGVQLGGIEFRNCTLSADSIVGSPGQALETAIKSFQITRTALPGMFIGILDTGLRTVIKYSRNRKLYGKFVADFPLTRSIFASIFVDLLICDCLSSVVARSIHVLPSQTSIYAPAVKYFVPRILTNGMNLLSTVLGASFYLREGNCAIFQKLLRDLKPSGFGHVSRVACQMTILPQLPWLARHSWSSLDAAPSIIFQFDQDLPPISFNCFNINNLKKDSLISSLVAVEEKISSGSCLERKKVLTFTSIFIKELNKLKHECLELPPNELSVMANQHTYNLTSRYTVLLAASACINLWLHSLHNNSFLSNCAWITIALHRLSILLGYNSLTLSEDLERDILYELINRYENNRSFDLVNCYLSGS
jgi:alkylation response protein AidB-like acyl-CoA dehydrogenase